VKVLLANDYGAATGGAEIQFLHIREALRARGHDARLFSSTAGSGRARLQADYTCFGTTSSFRTLLQTVNPWAARALRRALNDFRPDIAHVQLFLTQLSPMILPPLFKVPTLYHVSWYRPICPLGTKLLPSGAACRVRWGRACLANRCLPARDWIPLMLQRRLLENWRGRAFNRTISISEAVRQRLLADGFGDSVVIPNGVPDRGARPPLRDPPVAVFSGRLVPEKGADVLLRAFARVAGQLPDARLLVAGEGPQRDELARSISTLNLSARIDMTGQLDPDALEARCAPAWVHVVPSRWEEPFGLVAAEAMMRGTAVIASSGGGLGELVQEGVTGCRFRPGDVDQLSACLLRVLSDRNLAESLGRAGREAARARYSLDRLVDRLEDLYERLRREA
jgi:glycosyltransferase involved in cell wall biosynthesis